MTGITSSKTAKLLALRFVLQNIDHKKRCAYLQEIISLGKKDDIWRQALTQFFDVELSYSQFIPFSNN